MEPLRNKIWHVSILVIVLLNGPSYLHGGDAGSIMTRIAITATGANQSPFFLGKEAGLFRKHGLDVEVIYAPGNIALRALAAREVDVISGAGAFAIIPVLQGLNEVHNG